MLVSKFYFLRRVLDGVPSLRVIPQPPSQRYERDLRGERVVEFHKSLGFREV